MKAYFQQIWLSKKRKNAAFRTETIKKILDDELGPWLDIRKNLLHDYALDTIDEWNKLPDNEIFDKYSAFTVVIPLHHQYISLWCRSKYVHDALNGYLNLNALAMSTRSGIQSFMMDISVAKRLQGYGGHFTLDVLGPMLAQVITTGWRFQSEIVARNALRQIGGLLKHGESLGSCGQFMIALCCDWLQCGSKNQGNCFDFNIRENDIRKKLLRLWKTSDLTKLERTINHVADFHLDQSRDAETERDWFEFEDHGYWLFPVEILAVLRLREWLGLPNPRLKHPLLTSTQTCLLQPIPEWPVNPVLDEAYVKSLRVFQEQVDLVDREYLRVA